LLKNVLGNLRTTHSIKNSSNTVQEYSYTFQNIYTGYWRPSEYRAGPSGRAVYGVGLRSLSCWECGIEPPPGAWMSVCRECCVLSGRGLCDELITHPEESYRLWCVVVYDLEAPRMWKPWPTGVCCVKNKQKLFVRSTFVPGTFNRPVSGQTGVSWPSLTFSGSQPATIARIHFDFSLLPFRWFTYCWYEGMSSVKFPRNSTRRSWPI
jgi:hypothetical protein